MAEDDLGDRVRARRRDWHAHFQTDVSVGDGQRQLARAWRSMASTMRNCTGSKRNCYVGAGGRIPGKS